MDELFEALTLVQTGKVEACPIVLIGTAYWKPLLDLLDRMVAEATVKMADTQLIMATDDLGEAMRYIDTHAVERGWPPAAGPEARIHPADLGRLSQPTWPRL